MAATATQVQDLSSPWSGGKSPFGNVSWGKLMMWVFLLSDAFTFGSFLTAYGFIRFKSANWPDPEQVFDAAPILGHGYPLVFVGLMTFILIVSSVTMVLSVEAGHRKDRKGAALYLFLTILGGLTFLSCQAWEWTHLITGDPEHVKAVLTRTIVHHHDFAPQFGQFFFLITGFHGSHVLSGVILNLVVLVQILRGDFDRINNYNRVENIGLYWHFVDLVWVFVFTFFYLV
ncbi:MAG: cytochrome oxidase subunit III [Bacteroidetes bacterium]|nr:MAG: cytochrome oxidase subunit III [Bacteroidota bacterium]